MSYRNNRQFQANQDARFGTVPPHNPWMQHRSPPRDNDSNLSYDGAQINNLYNLWNNTQRQHPSRSQHDSVSNSEAASDGPHADPAITSLTEQMQALHLDLAANLLKPERLA